MAVLEGLPSLLAFTSQTELPPQEVLEDLRQELASSPHLVALKVAIGDLPKLWNTLVDFDPSLHQVSGDAYLKQLSHWVTHGGLFPFYNSELPSLLALPVMLLLQISQYTRYLKGLGNGSHNQVLQNIQDGGVQGFCVGFITAVCVASTEDEVGLGSAAATGLFLTVCIGAYVDQDAMSAGNGNKPSCVALRWADQSVQKEAEVAEFVNTYEDAYISSINEESCVTVTLRDSDLEHFLIRVREKGWQAKRLAVHGRFHHPRHSQAAEKLLTFAERNEQLSFPSIDKLYAPVRCSTDCSKISGGLFTHHALVNTLLKPINWYGTLKSSVSELRGGKHTAVVVGFGNSMPSSLAQSSSIEVLYLSKQGGSVLSQLPGILPAKGVNDTPPVLSQYPSHSIAIVGMAGRFPGAASVDELWDILIAGKIMAEPAPVERLQLSQTGDFAKTKWWGNFLQDPHAFDHRFFKKSSREALAWDPQQRILLEVIYEALEEAGYFGASSNTPPDDCGCYIGACMNNYYDNMSCHAPTAYATIGTSRCFISGCMSHYFGWTGPSLTIDTACSSSLVAINTACRAIWSGECSSAIAGGTNVISSPFDYQNLYAAGFLSPTGQCKPFDVAADGYCRGEGVAVVYLKRLSDAIKDNDNIHGVILGSAANQNYNDSHVTVPHSGSQVQLYRNVMKLGGVTPDSVSYVEAHGTGTGVGDPVEVQSIRDAFGGPQRDSLLHFGSIKGNIGHTEATAGISGLIKVLLMMRHGKIPAQASHTSVNPKIPAFDQHQMQIPRSILSWNPHFRVACVNSYGAAGSNSALLVCDKPLSETGTLPPASKYPLVLSAASTSSLSAYSSKLLKWLNQEEKVKGRDLLPSLLFNLADRANHNLPHILATTVTGASDLKSTLQAASSGSGLTVVDQSPKPVVLVFGGQENNFVGLSEEVYHSAKIFRRHIDRCNEILLSQGHESFYPSIFESDPTSNLPTLHAALFAVQYASAMAWMDGGLEVGAVIGHSFGQLTAFCISGALSLPDALKLVVGRASLMEKHWGVEPGSMIFLQTDRQTAEEVVGEVTRQNNGGYAEIACYNGPKSHVVVGSSTMINALEEFIARTRDSIRTKKLQVTHGFHSIFTEPLLPHLTALAQQLEWKVPTIHLETCDEFESTVNPDFSIVSNHTRNPVFFQSAVQRINTKLSDCIWIEAGRGSSVMQLVKGSLPDAQGHKFLSPQLKSSSNALSSLADAAIELWKCGHTTQYWPFHRSQKPGYEYVSLPPYQFEKTQHWLPFTGRGIEEPLEQPEPVSESHSLFSFLKYRDVSRKEAVFQIDPKSERFKEMLGGHVMAGYTLAPASLYFELVSRAALFLQGDMEAKVYVPTVDDLLMNSPIGQDDTKEILMILKRLDDPRPSWSFSITTQATVGTIAEPFEQSSGSVRLKQRDDIQAARDFQRFESITGYRRYEDLINHPNAELMQGNHIYRAFSTVVHYGEAFRGIKQVGCVGMEAAGKVVIIPNLNDPADQRLCDTPMTDSFMQFAGFLVNYFNNRSVEDVLVCMKIEHIEIGGGFSPDTKEWVVYSNMNEGGESDATSDAYVFDAATKKMVMAAFGFRFSKMPQSLLARLLKSINKGGSTSLVASAAENLQSTNAGHAVLNPDAAALSNDTPKETSESKRGDLFRVLSDVTDMPIDDINDDMTLEDLGMDSLMATEVLNDIRTVLGLTIDLTSFLFFPNIRAIAAYIDEKLGVTSDDSDDNDLGTPSSDRDSGVAGVTTPLPSKTATTNRVNDQDDLPKPSYRGGPVISSAFDAFQKTRFGYDDLAKGTGAVDFWRNAYPHQARLVLAYVVETFAQLGCNLRELQPGDRLPRTTKALDRHQSLLRQLHRVLEDGKLIRAASDEGFLRTDITVDPVPAETIFHQIINLHPQHANVNKLVRAVGSQLAACLVGDIDGLQIVFGNKDNKKTLEDMYEFWPLLRTPTLLLGDFLLQAFTNASGGGNFRILEIGAGTGGTTRYIVNHLRSHGISFEYTYTDISASLVSAAKKQFKGVDGMRFEVLDIEKPPKPDYLDAFHCIIATNCIHATRNLDVSLSNIRKMIREDGALTLVEITQNMFWLDIVVGLFEGWWLFQDGRSHALIDELHWERLMKRAGFDEVSWTDGAAPEAKTVRVIGAFPSAQPQHTTLKATQVKVNLETVVYKSIGDQDIHADVYCPVEENHLSGSKMPIALMIHGGSHVIFSRKDIRPAQTRLLLEKGFLPVSLDHRLCPEVSLSQGPMVDICDALHWARYTLPGIKFRQSQPRIDGERVVVVGWSSGGQLAMSLAWTAPQRGLRPPEAILAFYCPTNYEDEWWRHPIQPIGAEDQGQVYDVLEAIQDDPITNYGVVGAWEPLSDPRIMTDPRCRIVLHINWKAQTLPVIIGGLPSRTKAAISADKRDWNALPQPTLDQIRAVSPRAQIQRGNYRTPTFLIHGTADDLIPWQQSQGTYEALIDNGVVAGLALVDNAPHICDLSSDLESEGWKAALRGYDFISSYV